LPGFGYSGWTQGLFIGLALLGASQASAASSWTALFSFYAGALAQAAPIEKQPKAWLGIAFQDVTADTVPSAYQPISPAGVVRVLQVFKGTSADQAGLLPGDYLLAINGAPMLGRKTLLDTIHSHGVGDVIALKIGREGKVVQQKMALSPKPEDMSSLTKTWLGSPAPSLEGVYYQGEPASLADLKGKVIVIDFWATWCGPCRMTLPALDALYRKYRDQGVVIIGVSSENRPELEAFQKRQNLAYPLFQDIAQLTTRKYQAFAYPTLVLIDKQGLVQRVEVGAHSGEDMEKWITELL